MLEQLEQLSYSIAKRLDNEVEEKIIKPFKPRTKTIKGLRFEGEKSPFGNAIINEPIAAIQLISPFKPNKELQSRKVRTKHDVKKFITGTTPWHFGNISRMTNETKEEIIDQFKKNIDEWLEDQQDYLLPKNVLLKKDRTKYLTENGSINDLELWERERFDHYKSYLTDLVLDYYRSHFSLEEKKRGIEEAIQITHELKKESLDNLVFHYKRLIEDGLDQKKIESFRKTGFQKMSTFWSLPYGYRIESFVPYQKGWEQLLYEDDYQRAIEWVKDLFKKELKRFDQKESIGNPKRARECIRLFQQFKENLESKKEII